MRHALLAVFALGGCVSSNVIPNAAHCGSLIPPSMLKPTTPVDLPEPKQHADGHQDAEPWMVGFLGQTGQLDKANDRADGINYIYSQCERLNGEAISKSRHGFFGRLFG